jgi:hypothetical protein
MLAHGIAAAEAVAFCEQDTAREPYAWTRNWRTKRSAGAAVQTENGEKPRSRLTAMQSEFRLQARLTDCGRNANYCVMRTSGAPRGGYLRIPPSLAATGFQEIWPVSALLRAKGDA